MGGRHKALNERQRKFVEYYVGVHDTKSCGNAINSARRAGYSEASLRASTQKLLENPLVLDQIKAFQEQHTMASFSKQLDLKEELIKIAMSTEEKTTDRLRAFELIGKMDGAFVTKVEQTNRVESGFSKVSTDDLKKVIGNIVPLPKAK